MRFCDECGAPLEDNAIFCEECGAKAEPLEEVGNVPKNETNIEIVSDGKSKGNKSIAIIIVLILTIAIVAFILWKRESFFKEPKNSEPTLIVSAIPTTKVPASEIPVVDDEEQTEAVTTATESVTSTAPVVTTVPVTKSPATTVAVTTAPETAIPTSKPPVTVKPTTKAPMTKTPTTKAPTTKVPATTAPATKKPTKEPVKDKGNYVLTAKYKYNSSGDMIEASDYTYNAKGVLTYEHKYVADQSGDDGFYEYYYDKNGNPTKILRYDVDNKLMYKTIYEYKYDKNNNILTESYECISEGNSSEFDGDGYKEYTYYSDNTIDEEYIMTNGRYLCSNRYNYTYDANGKLENKECYSRDDFQDWYFVYEVDYTYDKNGRLIEEVLYNSALYAHREKIYYDAKGNISKIIMSEEYGTSKEEVTVKYEYIVW